MEHTPNGCGCNDHGHDSCGCGCGHDHCDDHGGCDCGCGHDHSHTPARRELPVLLTGGGLFILGLVLGSQTLPGGILLAAAYLLLGFQILLAAGKNLIKGHVLDEHFLMSVATLGAFAIGEFPEAVGIILFYRVGEFFEQLASRRSRSRILEAIDLRPETVTLPDGSVIPAGQAKPGDLLMIRPGDRIGLDCRVVRGESHIDTAPVTGEPIPVAVRPGDPILSGCINTSGQLTVAVEKPLSESLVTRILEAVEGAAAEKPRLQRFISRFAQIYTPAVVLAALLVAVVPGLVTGNWHYWIYTALSFLVMSCPCALVLSIPLSFFCGIGTAGKNGILFKDGIAMEALAGVRGVALDKTGTLTKGAFQVQPCESGLLQLCASCEQYSTHPIAGSILSQAAAQGLSLFTPDAVEELPGQGIRAQLEGKVILCGNEALLAGSGIAVPSGEDTVVHVAAQGEYLGSIRVSDTLKPDAANAVRALHRMGLSTAILTGDREENARAVARQTGVQQVHARLLPQQKLTALQQLRKEWGSILFVGDGINDAPVLAGADVGAAMGSGADASIEAADLVFLGNTLQSVPQAISIARRTRRIAWENVILSLGVKAVVMALGLLGFADLWLAVFADTGVAMLCVLNSLRLLFARK